MIPHHTHVLYTRYTHRTAPVHCAFLFWFTVHHAGARALAVYSALCLPATTISIYSENTSDFYYYYLRSVLDLYMYVSIYILILVHYSSLWVRAYRWNILRERARLRAHALRTHATVFYFTAPFTLLAATLPLPTYLLARACTPYVHVDDCSHYSLVSLPISRALGKNWRHGARRVDRRPATVDSARCLCGTLFSILILLDIASLTYSRSCARTWRMARGVCASIVV